MCCECQFNLKFVKEFKTQKLYLIMKTINTATIDISNYRKLIQTYIDLHLYSTALFWADKVVTLTGDAKDIYWLAQCMFLQKQYHRAIHLLRTKNLVKANIVCTYLTVKCLFEANELNEALKVIESVDGYFSEDMFSSSGKAALSLFDDTPKNQSCASFLLLKGKVLEAMDNRGLAADCYKQALHLDVYCFEAFDYLIKYQMLTASEERELLKSLPALEQCTPEEATLLLTLYEAKLKKYHTPIQESLNVPTQDISSNSSNIVQSSPLTPFSMVSPISISTPNIAKNNDKNIQRTEGRKPRQQDDSQKMHVEYPENSFLIKLKNNIDIQVAEAERLYYNCDYHQCSQLTESLLKEDPYHEICLSVHISCQVELKQSNKTISIKKPIKKPTLFVTLPYLCGPSEQIEKVLEKHNVRVAQKELFTLAHNLVDLYPNLAISWFAVGCYYYIIGKSELARRYLAKSTCLDRLFGPAWLAYGHSFAIENEHDQAMAAYFKASQLMKGCHLPLLYIGLECGLTNNVRLAEKFFQQAQTIAPDDPFIMHEKGVICFQNMDYETAETHFQNALERVKKIKKGIIPQSWTPLVNNLGQTCRKLKKYKEALDFHYQALVLNPQSAGTYSAIAYTHVLMGNNDEAVEWFHKALGLKRDDTFSITMLNYIMGQLADETPPYLDCPEEIPKYEFKVPTSTVHQQTETECSSLAVNMEMSDMSIESLEMDETDRSLTKK